MSKKKGGGDKKKGEGDETKELREFLQLDIDRLENLIYFEQEKELFAKCELDQIEQKTKDELKAIESLTQDESKKIILESDSMKGTISSFTSQINFLEKEINDYNEKIQLLIAETEEVDKKNKEEIENLTQNLN